MLTEIIGCICDMPYPMGTKEPRELGRSEGRGGEDRSEIKVFCFWKRRVMISSPNPFLANAVYHVPLW